MKAKIIEKKYYVAKLKDGREISVDESNPLIKKAIESGELIEGNILKEEIQNKYTDGTYSRSYTIVEEFIPIKKEIKRIGLEKDFKVDDFLVEPTKKDRKIPYVPKEERYNEERITLPNVDPNKVKLMNEGIEPKHIKLK